MDLISIAQLSASVVKVGMTLFNRKREENKRKQFFKKCLFITILSPLLILLLIILLILFIVKDKKIFNKVKEYINQIDTKKQ